MSNLGARGAFFLVVGAAAVGWPAEERVSRMPIGTIAGIVINDEQPPRAVRRATVTASSPSLKTSRSAISDDEGRFTIGDLPPGSYSVVAARATFVTSAHGALRPARPGLPVLVGADGVAPEIRIRLWRAGVISGTVRDERGQPVEGLSVRALPLKRPSERFMSLTNNGAPTDADGRFRIFGLEPGQYFLAVVPSAVDTQARLALQDAHVDAMLTALRSGNRLAAHRLAADLPPPARMVYSAIYYPGTANAAAALPISVTAGGEVGGLDLPFSHIPAVRVSGRVVLPDGLPAAGAQVRLANKEASPYPGLARPVYGATADGNGAYTIQHVPPGDYDLSVSARADSPDLPRSTASPSRTLWATSSLSVVRQDVDGLQLRVAPGLTVSGRFRTANQRSLLAHQFLQIRVALIPTSVSAPQTIDIPPS